MGLIDDIRSTANKAGTSIQSAESEQISKELNKLFYCKKRPEEEMKFMQQLFTRGTESAERVGLHASAIIKGEHEFCVRQQVLSLLYKQEQGENIQIGLKRIFEEGNAIHEKWQRLFIRGELGTWNNMDRSRFVKQYELSYTPDAIVDVLGETMVCEIKSMNTFEFQKSDAHPSGAKQLQLYLHFKKLPHGFVLMDDKNTQNFKVQYVEYNPDVVQPYIERLENVMYCKERVLTQGKMEPRKEECTSYLSKRALKCPMRDACFNKGKGRVRLDGVQKD